MKRFVVLSDNPTGDKVGALRFGDVEGYGVWASSDLAEAIVLCNDHVSRQDQLSRYHRLRVVDLQTFNRKTISIVYEVGERST